MRLGILCGSLLLALVGSAFAAGQPPGAAKAWQSLTRIDVETAYDLLKDNHPAALAETGDARFIEALKSAHAKALSRVPAATTYGGYRATLAEFANSMGDGHIWSNAQLLPRTVNWPGIVPAKRGSEWVVSVGDPAITGEDVSGAKIESCDGRPVEALEREVMPFHVSTGDPGFEVVRAGWLLLDDGNPFVTLPKSCTFDDGGKSVILTLNWTKTDYVKLVQNVWKHAYGQAGFEFRQSGAGYWIGIQSLEPKAQPVIDAAKAKANDIRKSAYVVVDLRGNGGGGDSYGRAIAEVIYGAEYVNAVLGPAEDSGGGCKSLFRASDGNIDALAKSAEEFAHEGNTEGAKEYRDAVVAMKAARAKGHALTDGPLVCTDKTSAPAAASSTPSLMTHPVFVLADATCFSSCINTVDFFRRLGAIQLGATTGSDTHYSEVREIVLPSGLSTFSTLQAIMPDAPAKIGPFAPNYPYPGDIADTAALEKWVSDTVMPLQHK